jgi:hypothetical protein
MEAPKPDIEVPVTMSAPAQDTQNNNSTASATVTVMEVRTESPKPVTPSPPPAVVDPTPAPQQQQPPLQVQDINDTNNNNYQKVTPSPPQPPPPASDENLNEEMMAEEVESDEPDRAAINDIDSQDTNNNSETDDKSSGDGPINYDDDQWSPANTAGKKYYTRDQLLKLKDLLPAPPVKLPDGVANTLLKYNKDFLTTTLTQTMPRQTYDAIAPKFMIQQPSGRNLYQKRPSQTKQPVSIGIY